MSEKSTTSIACNKWGMPTKTTTNYGSSKSTIKYAYDKKGGITKTTYSTGTTRYKNSYKNGNLVKRTQLQRYDGDSEYVTSYTYKALKVNKDYAPVIKAQVAALQVLYRLLHRDRLYFQTRLFQYYTHRKLSSLYIPLIAFRHKSIVYKAKGSYALQIAPTLPLTFFLINRHNITCFIKILYRKRLAISI